MTGEDRECPIDLFGQHNPGKRMRQRHRSERKLQPRALAHHVAPAACRPNREDKMLRALITALPKPHRERFRAHQLSPTIQQHRKDRRPALLPLEPLRKGILGLECLRFAPRKGGAPFEILSGQNVEFILDVRPRPNVCHGEKHRDEDTGNGGPAAASLCAGRESRNWKTGSKLYHFPYISTSTQYYLELKLLIPVNCN